MLNHGIVAVVIKDNKFLLLEDCRKLMLGYWAPPCGGCDPSMSEEECVIKEVLDETNLKIKPIKKLWTTNADTKLETVSFWLVELISGEIKIDNKDASKYGWFTLEEGLELKLYPGTRKLFELIKRGDINVSF